VNAAVRVCVSLVTIGAEKHLHQHITSRQNARVKEAAKLRQRGPRERESRFVIDGAREILRAIAAGIEVIEAYVCEPLRIDADAREASQRLHDSGAAIATVTPEVFAKLCFGEGRDGLVAVGATPQRSLDQLALRAAPLVAVIEGLEKPGNVGAVMRSADGAGVDAVIVADPRTDLYNPNTIRASLGTVFGAGVCTASTAETLAWLRRLAIPIFAARPESTVSYAKADYRDGAAIVLGSEAEGLSAAWQGAGVTAIGLPMRGMADSLNVSATAAVLFYEAQRQRQLNDD
jgi:RNA methyltransferase, TrmH family